MNALAAGAGAPHYAKYLALVPESDLLDAMHRQGEATRELLASVSEPESLIRHAPYTWSIREVVGHVIDAERIFAYRALRIGRGDATPLAGFDENAYAQAAGSDRFPLAELTAELQAVRQASLWLFRHLEAAEWDRRGTANDVEVTVRVLAATIIGHERHHVAIVRGRLGQTG